METSNRLREVRTELNITQAEFARRLDESVMYINKVESGAFKLQQETMVKLHKWLGVDLNWLLCGEGNMF